MRRTTTRLALLAISLFSFSSVFGQISEQAGKEATLVNKGTAGSTFNMSPNLHHQHDGEHCLADALTNAWIEEMGIEEQYKAEQTHGNMLAQHMGNSNDRATYTIPIIFHVVHNPNNPAENVSQTAIYNLLTAVNEDFSATNSDVGNLRTGFGWSAANADIEFCLAQKDPQGQQLAELGIHRVATTEDFYDPNTETNKMKDDQAPNTGTPGWDRNSYVNVWICDITDGAPSGTAGYAYKPTVSTLPPASIDGIVIDYNLGLPPTNRVLTHELGHYLGLSHTWGNSNQASGCTADDGLTDTPNTAGPSFDYPGSCTGSQQTCAPTETQYENFMDYSNCTIIFTQEQANLMTAVLTGSRNSLNSSDACTPVNPSPPVANFVADITSVVEGGSINFTDLSSNLPTTWSWSITPAAGEVYVNGTSSSSQNPVIQFPNAGTYTVTLTASNAYGSDDEIKTSYITVVASGGGTIDCDTIRNYTPAEEANMTAYGLTGGDGYYPGHIYIPPGANAFQMQYIADSFFVATPTEVRRLYLPVYQADDLGAANDVIFTVWSNNGATPGPGIVLGTETVPISNLNAGFWNTIDFTTPVPVNGEFWVGVELEYSTTTLEDTVLFATTNFSDRPSGPSSTWVRGWEPLLSLPYNWQSTTSFFTSNPDCSLILDVLTSTGPPPTAIAAWPANTTCEGMDITMNGYGSLNAASYYWDITDGTNDYYSDQGNFTTGLTEASWTFNLEVDGSCMTDIDGPFVMTVNPPMTANYSITDENCIAEDGAITVTLSGGDGGPYNYSINGGTTVEATGTYTGLLAGDYPCIFTDANNCELIDTVTVGNANTFAPTITPDQTIPPATSTDLTVTGGVSWTWYANEGQGPLQIGNTQTITVAPVVTTEYVCSVTDGSGCEAELSVVLTVDSSATVEENWINNVEMYPNPTDGNFALIFKLNEAKDLQVEVINIIGEKVFVGEFNQVKDQSINFDLTGISAGVYFVSIRSGEESISKKIVIR
ncbi:MAG: T9SS type A sorting domain-containing protein [Crocinitomicaceae bacterium]|nr:T9SS type A sorting domain-containing protein [Crocinitomicaceae bacterium]